MSAPAEVGQWRRDQDGELRLINAVGAEFVECSWFGGDDGDVCWPVDAALVASWLICDPPKWADEISPLTEASTASTDDPGPRHRHDASSGQSGDLRHGRWGPHECPVARVPMPLVYPDDPRRGTVRVVGREEDGTCWAISLLPGQATDLAIRLNEVVAQMDRRAT